MRESPTIPVVAAGPRRDPVLDILRGLFLTLMTIDHLDGALAKYGYEAFGYVTAAEGFVLLSGFVAARVYGGMRARDPQRFRAAVLKRALLLYVAHVLLVLVAIAAVWARGGAGHHGGPYEPFLRAPLEYLLKALSFQFQPYLLDVLPMYVLLVAGLPLLLGGMAVSRVAVLFASAGVWFLSLWLETESWVEGSGAFIFPSWQLLFVGGALLASLPPRVAGAVVRSRLAFSAAIAVIVTGLALRYGFSELVPSWWVHRPELGPGRLLSVLAFAVVVARVTRPLAVPQGLTWFAFLGRHSLYVFMWHFPVVLLGKPQRVLGVLRGAGLSEHIPAFAVDLGVTLAACLSLAIPAWMHATWRARVRRPISAVGRVELGPCQ